MCVIIVKSFAIISQQERGWEKFLPAEGSTEIRTRYSYLLSFAPEGGLARDCRLLEVGVS